MTGAAAPVPARELAAPDDGPEPPVYPAGPIPVPDQDDTYDERDVWWSQLPEEIGDDAAIGLVHTDAECPVMVLRVTNGTSEIAGPPGYLQALADTITNANLFLGHLARDAAGGAQPRAAG